MKCFILIPPTASRWLSPGPALSVHWLASLQGHAPFQEIYPPIGQEAVQVAGTVWWRGWTNSRSLSVSKYTYIHTPTHPPTHTHAPTVTHTHAHAFKYTHIPTRAHIHYIPLNKHTHMLHAHTHTHTHTPTHTYTHTYLHTHILTHTQLYT